MKFHLGAHSASFILLLVSLAFFLLASITTPTAKGLSLGSYGKYSYGIFGYCESSGKCSEISYPVIIGDVDTDAKWKFSGSTRNTLAKIFILAPISAGLSFLCLVLVFVCHFMSSGALIFTILFNVVTFAVGTACCVVVILAFYPHVSWTGWVLVGGAAASLISTALLVVALVTNRVEDEEVEDEYEEQGLNTFERDIKFPTNIDTMDYANTSDTRSVDDYEYAAKKPGFSVAQSKSEFSGSSIYETPHTARDFTVNAVSSSSLMNQVKGSDEDKISFMNGPNTPIQSKQHVVPDIAYKVATPGNSEPPSALVPQLPYPPNDRNNFNSRQNEGGFSSRDNVLSNMERKSDADSDLDSDFTSVSQRAINPKYNPQYPYNKPSNVFGAPVGGPVPIQSGNMQKQMLHPQHQHQNQNQYQYQQRPPQPQMQHPMYSPQQQHGYGNGSVGNSAMYSPQNMNFQPMPRQGYYAPKPTVSDQVLSNNPDFSIGFKKKNNKAMFPGATSMTGGNRF